MQKSKNIITLQSLNGIITEPGKLITFPPNVIVIGCQSISIISHNVFAKYKVIFSLFMLLSSSFSLSKVLCCLSKLNFLYLYLSTNSLNVFSADNNSSSKSSDSNDISRTCSCLVTL